MKTGKEKTKKNFVPFRRSLEIGFFPQSLEFLSPKPHLMDGDSPGSDLLPVSPGANQNLKTTTKTLGAHGALASASNKNKQPNVTKWKEPEIKQTTWRFIPDEQLGQ